MRPGQASRMFTITTRAKTCNERAIKIFRKPFASSSTLSSRNNVSIMMIYHTSPSDTSTDSALAPCPRLIWAQQIAGCKGRAPHTFIKINEQIQRWWRLLSLIFNQHFNEHPSGVDSKRCKGKKQSCQRDEFGLIELLWAGEEKMWKVPRGIKRELDLPDLNSQRNFVAEKAQQLSSAIYLNCKLKLLCIWRNSLKVSDKAPGEYLRLLNLFAFPFSFNMQNKSDGMPTSRP